MTTRVDVPADSTEEEYFQACNAAKIWMEAQPRTGASLFEGYLAMVQASPTGTAGSWNARWAELTLARQTARSELESAVADLREYEARPQQYLRVGLGVGTLAPPPATNAASAGPRFERLRNCDHG